MEGWGEASFASKTKQVYEVNLQTSLCDSCDQQQWRAELQQRSVQVPIHFDYLLKWTLNSSNKYMYSDKKLAVSQWQAKFCYGSVTLTVSNLITCQQIPLLMTKSQHYSCFDSEYFSLAANICHACMECHGRHQSPFIHSLHSKVVHIHRNS